LAVPSGARTQSCVSRLCRFKPIVSIGGWPPSCATLIAC